MGYRILGGGEGGGVACEGDGKNRKKGGFGVLVGGKGGKRRILERGEGGEVQSEGEGTSWNKKGLALSQEEREEEKDIGKGRRRRGRVKEKGRV